MSSLFNQCASQLKQNEGILENAQKSLEIPCSSSSLSDVSESTVEDQNDLNSDEATTSQTDFLTRSPQNNDHQTLSSEKTGLRTNVNSYITINTANNLTLRPPQTKTKPKQPKKDDVNSVFEIYVSKFDQSTTCDGIVAHIVNNTSLENNDQFNVAKIKYKLSVAYKITVLKKEVFDLIMDNSIRSPDYSACLFDNSKANKPNEHHKNGQVQNKSENSTDFIDNGGQNSNQLRQQSKIVKQITDSSKNARKQTPKQTNIRATKTPSRALPQTVKKTHSFRTNAQSYQFQNQQSNPAPLIYTQASSSIPQSLQYQNGNFWYSHNGLHQPQQNQNYQLSPMYTQQTRPLYSQFLYPTN